MSCPIVYESSKAVPPDPFCNPNTGAALPINLDRTCVCAVPGIIDIPHAACRAVWLPVFVVDAPAPVLMREMLERQLRGVPTKAVPRPRP